MTPFRGTTTVDPIVAVTILYTDDHILVVQKPAGLLAQPDRTGDVDVLSLAKRRVREAGDDDPFLGLVHRLDRPTSGLMILARNSAAARALSEQFRERTVEKQYLALLEGQLRGIGHWADYIAKLDRQPQIVSADNRNGKRAVLDWQVVERSRTRTLAQLTLRTGRPHQIRLQAAERGYPVVGDTRYGASTSWHDGQIALHHAIMRVDHPVDPRRDTFVAPVPDAWNGALTEDMEESATRLFEQARPGS